MNTTVPFSTVSVICSGTGTGGAERTLSGVRVDLFRKNVGLGAGGLSSADSIEVAEVEVLMEPPEASDERDDELEDAEILPPKLDLTAVTGGLGSD